MLATVATPESGHATAISTSGDPLSAHVTSAPRQTAAAQGKGLQLSSTLPSGPSGERRYCGIHARTQTLFSRQVLLLSVDWALIKHNKVVRVLVGAVQEIMQGFDPLPTERALQLVMTATFQQQQ